MPINWDVNRDKHAECKLCEVKGKKKKEEKTLRCSERRSSCDIGFIGYLERYYCVFQILLSN